jgi:hypothetical protein
MVAAVRDLEAVARNWTLDPVTAWTDPERASRWIGSAI